MRLTECICRVLSVKNIPASYNCLIFFNENTVFKISELFTCRKYPLKIYSSKTQKHVVIAKILKLKFFEYCKILKIVV